MIFNPTTKTRRVIGTLLAAGIVGGTATGALAASHSAPAQPPKPVQASAQSPPAQPPAVVRAAAAKSTVPKPLTRAETAAEDVIGFLEKGQPAKSKAEARVLRDLARGPAADALRQAGLPQSQIAAFQQRAERTARLSLGGAPTLAVSQSANSVSQLMAGFYARFQGPVPAAVLKLDYLERQVQLDSQAGQQVKLRQTVARLDATWQRLRPQLVKAGGAGVAGTYDRHVTTLKGKISPTATQKQAVRGLDLVDKMETAFLGK